MHPSRACLFAATRRSALTVSAVLGIATSVAAQGPYRLTIFTSAGGYLGTAQVTSTPAGINCRSESSGNLPNGGTCGADFSAGATVTLTATPLYDGTFDGWVGACAGQGATCHVAMTGPQTTSPKTIAKTYTLTIRSVPTSNSGGRIGNNGFFARPPLACVVEPGGVTNGTCVTEFPANQTVWLSREGHMYARFLGYSGCGGDSFDCRFVMEGPRIVTAGWMAMEIIVGSSGGNGTGRVTGIATPFSQVLFDCSITPMGAIGRCGMKWEDGIPPDLVTLTATPAGNSVFAGWSGRCSGAGPCVIHTELDFLPVTALFTIPGFPLAITGAGSGSGSVISTPSGITCTLTAGATGQVCSAIFAPGTLVRLTANPINGSTFGGWSGACSGTAPTCVVTVNTASQSTAHFSAPRPAAQLALALLGQISLAANEQRELDRFGNKDGHFNLGDLLALVSRTGEQLSQTKLSALTRVPASPRPRSDNRRTP